MLLFAIVAGLGAAAATVAGQYHSIQVTKQAEAEIAETLTVLGEFIEEGHALSLTLENQNAPVDVDKVNDWAKRVEDYLSNSPFLGSGFVSRFRDGSGLEHGEPIVDQPHSGFWNGVTERVTRLQQFSGEIAAKPLR